jgi:hypothetical protein
MLHIFKFVLSDYITDEDKFTLLQGNRVEDFDPPFNKLNINIHWNTDYALRYASNNGNIEVVKYLIEAGADIHADDSRAIRESCKHGHLQVVEFLVGRGLLRMQIMYII